MASVVKRTAEFLSSHHASGLSAIVQALASVLALAFSLVAFDKADHLQAKSYELESRVFRQSENDRQAARAKEAAKDFAYIHAPTQALPQSARLAGKKKAGTGRE